MTAQLPVSEDEQIVYEPQPLLCRSCRSNQSRALYLPLACPSPPSALTGARASPGLPVLAVASASTQAPDASQASNTEHDGLLLASARRAGSSSALTFVDAAAVAAALSIVHIGSNIIPTIDCVDPWRSSSRRASPFPGVRAAAGVTPSSLELKPSRSAVVPSAAHPSDLSSGLMGDLGSSQSSVPPKTPPTTHLPSPRPAAPAGQRTPRGSLLPGLAEAAPATHQLLSLLPLLGTGSSISSPAVSSAEIYPPTQPPPTSPRTRTASWVGRTPNPIFKGALTFSSPPRLAPQEQTLPAALPSNVGAEATTTSLSISPPCPTHPPSTPSSPTILRFPLPPKPLPHPCPTISRLPPATLVNVRQPDHPSPLPEKRRRKHNEIRRQRRHGRWQARLAVKIAAAEEAAASSTAQLDLAPPHSTGTASDTAHAALLT